MLYDDAETFLTQIGPGKRLLGLDVGEKTIGLALSDVGRVIASPYDTIKRKKFSVDAASVFAVMEKEGVGGLVIGYPINMDGTEGRKCQSIRQFAKNLDGVQESALFLWDERLSTVLATNTLLEADLSRKRRAELVDKLAASSILQSFLDYAAHRTPSS